MPMLPERGMARRCCGGLVVQRGIFSICKYVNEVDVIVMSRINKKVGFFLNLVGSYTWFVVDALYVFRGEGEPRRKGRRVWGGWATGSYLKEKLDMEEGSGKGNKSLLLHHVLVITVTTRQKGYHLLSEHRNTDITSKILEQ